MYHWLLHALNWTSSDDAETVYCVLPADPAMRETLTGLFRQARELHTTDPAIVSLGRTEGRLRRYYGDLPEPEQYDRGPHLVWLPDDYRDVASEADDNARAECTLGPGGWYTALSLGHGYIAEIWSDGLTVGDLAIRDLADVNGPPLRDAFARVAEHRPVKALEIVERGLEVPVLAEGLDPHDPEVKTRPIAEYLTPDLMAPLLEHPRQHIRERAVQALSRVRKPRAR